MLKKAFLSAALLVFIFLASGCGTISKGSSGFAQGIKEDWAWLTKAAQNSDDWLKANLW